MYQDNSINHYPCVEILADWLIFEHVDWIFVRKISMNCEITI